MLQVQDMETTRFRLDSAEAKLSDYESGAQLRELVPLIPLERLLIETDAPFLRPHNAPKTQPKTQPKRQPQSQSKGDRRNEPALLSYVVEQLAELYGRRPAEIAAATHNNAEALFHLAD